MFRQHLFSLRPDRPIATVLLSCALILYCAPTAVVAAESPAEIKQKQADLNNLRSKIKLVESSLSKVKTDQSSLAVAVRESEQEISKLSTSMRELDNKIKATQKEAGNFEGKRDQIQKNMQHQLKLLGYQIRSSYVSGRQQKVKMLLNQEDPAVLGRMLAYYEYLAAARSSRIEHIQSELIELIELESSLQEELERLRGLRKERAAQLESLVAKRKDRNIKLGALEADIKNSGKELGQLRQQENALESLIQALKDNLQIPAEFRNAQPFGNSKSKLPWPARGRILARYGQSKHGTSLTWDGIWISTKAGTPVRAVSTGRVVYVGWLHRYGLIVLVEHPGGYYSLYGHNQEAMVVVGDSLKAGQILARAGDSGGHRNPGVYFEIRKGKNPVNPLSWLKR